MSPSLFAAVLLAFGSQTPEPSVEQTLAPLLTPDEIAAACLNPARRQSGERDRECQYRMLREEEMRGHRLASLRFDCERAPDPAGETVDACIRRRVTAEVAAREARRAEIGARSGRLGFDPENPFAANSLASALSAAPPPPPVREAPAPRERQGCRSEVVRNPDGSGGSVIWVCGDGEAADSVREALRPRQD